jgi:uncharacterized repeat protein (TIGR01451 family)
MNAPRRAYRPEVVAVLESRLALSHVAVPASVHHVQQAAERAEYAPVMQPDFTVGWKGSDGTQVLKRSGRVGDGQLLSSVQTQLPNAELVAIGSPPNVATIRVAYDNQSPTRITSATISDTLNRDLTFVPGSATSSANTQVTTTTDAGDVQTVQFSLADGIAPHAQGYLEFQVARNG